jgi:hypothetical protein
VNKKVSYAVAMSKDTGCIVMVRTRGKQIEVMGSMTRAESMDFVRSIAEWADETIQAEPRIAFNH